MIVEPVTASIGTAWATKGSPSIIPPLIADTNVWVVVFVEGILSRTTTVNVVVVGTDATNNHLLLA